MPAQKTTNNLALLNTFANEKLGLGNEAYYLKWYGERPPEYYLWILAEIIKIGRPGNILELGCGPGLFVEMAFNWGLNVAGCDGSQDGLRIALRRQPKLKLTQCYLSGTLPFDADSVDNVLLNQVIEHLPAEVFTNVLNECQRVLRTGGMIFIFSPNKANKQEVIKDPTHTNPLYPSELRNFLLTRGFEIVCEPNSPRVGRRIPFFSKLASALMKTKLRDWVSATANAYARKR